MELQHELKCQEAADNRANDEVIRAIWVLKTYGFADDRLMQIARDESFQRILTNTRRSAHIDRERMLGRSKHKDLHTETAAKMFNVPYEEVAAEQRSAAKGVNFYQAYAPAPQGRSMNKTTDMAVRHTPGQEEGRLAREPKPEAEFRGFSAVEDGRSYLTKE